MNKAPLLRLAGLSKQFVQGGKTLSIFEGLDLHVAPGEIVALVGQSGSGKTTLLQMAGLLDRPSAGEVWFDGYATSTMSEKQRTQLRAEAIGFIYQFHHLLPEFSATENVAMGAIIQGRSQKKANERASKLLHSLGLGERLSHRPAQLSGGEQQRVAIARALMNRPALIFADEPTGNLDPATAQGVFDLLLAQVRQRQMGALIATHNLELASKMDRVLTLKDGILSES